MSVSSLSSAESRAAERKRLLQAVQVPLSQGAFDTAFALAADAAQRYNAEQDSEGQALTLFLLGLCYRRLNDLPTSLEKFEESIALYRQLGDEKWEADALRAQAVTLRILGRDAEAVDTLKRCGAIYRQLGETAEAMRTQMNLATLVKQSGDIAKSQELLYECLAFFEQADASDNTVKADLSKVLLNIATNYSVLEKPADTIRFARQGIPLLEAIDDLPNLSQALCVLGTTYMKQGDDKSALEQFRRALHIAEQLNIKPTIAIILDDIATVLIHMERFDEARDALERCVQLSESTGSRFVYCGNLLSLGNLYANPRYEKRDTDKALACLTEAEQIAEAQEAGMLLPDIYKALANLHEQRGDFMQALQAFRAFYESDKRVFNQASDERIQRLEVEKAQKDTAIAQLERDKAKQEAEINHLRLVELVQALKEAERLRAQADAWARIDALTGVLNRRALDHAMEELFQQSLRQGTPLALALLDVDHFKKINDGLGHGAGDVVLSKVARLLEDSRHPGGFIARFGGEEFALLFPDTDLPKAFALCENLRAVIATQDWAAVHPGLSKVTISVGISVLNRNSRDRLTVPAALLAEADQNLYRAKRGGRNQVAG